MSGKKYNVSLIYYYQFIQYENLKVLYEAHIILLLQYDSF